MIPPLCEDLLQEIGHQMSTVEQGSLRAVCRTLQNAIDPLFFRSVPVVVDLSNVGMESLLRLDTLAGGNTGWSRYGQKLLIRRLSPDIQEPSVSGEAQKSEGRVPAWSADFKMSTAKDAETPFSPAQEQITKRLAAALEALKNIRAVHWIIATADPAWAKITVVEYLNQLQHLQDFELSDGGRSGMETFYSAFTLSNLRRLHVLAEGYKSEEKVSIVRWMRQVVSTSPGLKALGVPSTRGLNGICNELQAKNILLKELSVTGATSRLLGYLTSYSGLEHLALSRPDRDELAKTFFDTVLPNHADSLRTLSCRAGFEGPWCLGPHNIERILSLQRLQRVEISLNADDVAVREGNINILQMFLTQAADIPALISLCIRSTKHPSERVPSSLNPKPQMYVIIVQFQIDRAINAFGTSLNSTSLSRLIQTHHEQIGCRGDTGA
ncbi:hypothetical protein C8R43DRAFT_1242425 [Mycena crocata]|nr:hypothetical protein C8R43DRAFT_1242425 [Mycena crocata]